MKTNQDFYAAPFTEASFCSSEIFKILHTCDDLKYLMIGIYLIKEDRFLYANKVFESLLGFESEKLINRGWDFWFSLIPTHEVDRVRERIFHFFSSPSLTKDLLILQYHVTSLDKKSIYIKHEILIYQLEGKTCALNYFFDISEKEEIERCVKINGGYRGRSLFKNQNTQISTREKEVLKLIADGFSSKQIADKLFISNHTAISHRKHLIQKFRVKNTAQLVKEAFKLLEL